MSKRKPPVRVRRARRAQPRPRARRRTPSARQAARARVPPAVDDTPDIPADAVFRGPRPESMRRGVEPAFLLFERDILARVVARAAALGVRFQSLAKQIVRDHVDAY